MVLDRVQFDWVYTSIGDYQISIPSTTIRNLHLLEAEKQILWKDASGKINTGLIIQNLNSADDIDVVMDSGEELCHLANHLSETSSMYNEEIKQSP